MATRFEIWQQAVQQMERAVAELDQARATLKEIRLDQLGFVPRPNSDQLVTDADALLKELREAECDDCGHLLAWHGDRYGCEYERGDVQMPCRDGGTILAAAGPCGCGWGLATARQHLVAREPHVPAAH